MSENHAATYLQIDLQNLFFEARNQGQKIDFDKVWHFFSDRETEILTAASIYLIRAEDFDSRKFETKLKTLGYDIKVKNVTKRPIIKRTFKHVELRKNRKTDLHNQKCI